MEIKFSYLIILILLLSSCSKVVVTKVTDGNAQTVGGVKYSLPKVYLEFKPSPTGGGEYEVEIVYLPDKNQTYAIEGSTFFGSLTNAVTIKNGLLTKIDFDGGQPDVASEAISTVGSVLSEELKRKQKKEDEREAEIKKLKDAVEEKQLARDKAQKAYKLDPTTENKIKLEQAEIDLQYAKNKLEKVQSGSSDVANLPQNQNANTLESANTLAWGPVFYEIQDTYNIYTKQGDVKVVAVKWPDGQPQGRFQTVKVETPEKKPETKLNYKSRRFAFKDGVWQMPQASGIAFTQKVKGVDNDQSDITPEGGGNAIEPSPLHLTLNSDDNKTLEIWIDGSVAPGNYDVLIIFQGQNGVPGSVSFLAELIR